LTNAKRHLGHTARKRFGQNFLCDQHVIDEIVSCIGPSSNDNLVEIGPGLGALTEPVAELIDSLTVVELDRDLATRLRQHPFIQNKLTVIEQDALKFDFASLATESKLRIFGNLPYNISTPLMFHLFSFKECVEDMHFMLQLEVVKRLCATHGDSLYGKLSVMAAYYCQATPVLMVPPDHSVAVLEQVVGAAFNQRRKTVRNSLKNIIDAATLASLDIDAQRRAQTLSLAEFSAIANYVYETEHG